MSDINLDFTVSNNSIDFTVQPNDITITPTDIQLSVYTSGAPIARGANMEVQYNNEGLLEGNPAFTFDSDTNLLSIGNINTGDLLATGEVVIGNAITSNVNIYANTLSSIETNLGDVSNITIDGGTNGYVLQTDGAGNLSWTAQTGGGGNGTPGGSNTQIQYNDNGVFGGNTGFTFNEVTGNVAIPGNLSVVGNIAGNVQTAYLANYATVANSVAVANVSGIGNIAVVNLTGSTSNVLYGNGVFAPIANISSANFANFAGNVTVAAQPNITSLGNLVSLTLTSANIQLGNGSIAPGTDDIAIGNTANANQGNSSYSAVAIGESSYAVRGGIAIGKYAGKFGTEAAANANLSIAIGLAAGYGNNRGANSIAIGTNSGINCAANTIAIGRSAGYIMGGNSIAIGALAAASYPNTTPSNTITLNATGSNLVPTQTNSTFIKPIRNIATANYMYYNPTSGELSYSTPIAAGSNTAIQFNNANALAGNSGFTFNNVTGTIQMPGDLTVAGNLQVGNLIANNSNYANFAGTVLTNAQPNITSVGTLTSLSVSGNITGGNLIGTLATAAQPNITSVGTLTSLAIVGGDLSVGQIGTPGNITMTDGRFYVSTVGNGYIQVGIQGLWYANTGALQAGNINGNNFSTSGNANIGNLRFTGNISGTPTPNTASSTTPTHKLPIVLNGITYYICLTDTL